MNLGTVVGWDKFPAYCFFIIASIFIMITHFYWIYDVIHDYAETFYKIVENLKKLKE